MRILLAEDDHSQAESIKSWLEMDGYTVDWVERGDHAILAIEQHEYDCLLLDRGLPKATGDEILKVTRQNKMNIPVIFLTAKDSIQHRVDGLDLGANDYLVKPSSLEELSARVRSQLRQKQTVATSTIEFANLVLDVQAKQLKQDNNVVDLTAKEFVLLQLLIQHQGDVLSRTQIASMVWNINFETDTNVVDVAIRRLRAKIDDHFAPKLIYTVRGMGYKVDIQDEIAE